VKLVGLVRTGALAIIVVGLAPHLAVADPLRLAQAMPAGTMPPSEIVLIVRSAGLIPTSEPALAGATYLVRAVDRYGTPIRVIIEARYGYILSVQRLARTEPTRPPYGAVGMRDYADDDANGLSPPRAIPGRPPLAPDRSLSPAPVRPPLPKPRATTPAEQTVRPGLPSPAEQSVRAAPPPERSPLAEGNPPTAHPAAIPPVAKQAAQQEHFPPVTPLQ
jgi:hypothetical protein